MKQILLTTVFALVVQVGFAQKQFTLTELWQMNQLSETQLTIYLTQNGFISEGSFEKAGIKSQSFSDSKTQKVTKTFTPNGYSGLVWQSPQQIAIAQLKKELEESGFEKKSTKDLEHLTIEVYMKGKKGVTLNYSDDTETGKLLSLYLVAIQEKVN